jgi:NTP pyrophosphatase (non-canonical NTP hydrolase)
MDELQKQIIDFRNARNWKQFHTVQNLLLGLNIEVGELQECFLWKSEKEVNELDDKEKEKVANELSDVFVYLTYIANHYNIDLTEAVKNKLEINGKKYPVEKSFGSRKKYDEL